jgi:MraZ protein
MFTGLYECTLDEKGRLSVPAKLREILNQKYESRLILSRWFDGCLALFPYEEWVKIADKLRESTSLTNLHGRRLQRIFFSSVTECSPDRQGRITIPQKQKQMGDIDRQVVLVGMGDKIEIWAREKYNYEDDQSLEALAETISGLKL